MCRDDLVTIEADPHARDLRTAVAVDRHQVGERAGKENLACAAIEKEHPGKVVDWRDTTAVYCPVFTLASEPIGRVVGALADAAAG